MLGSPANRSGFGAVTVFDHPQSAVLLHFVPLHRFGAPQIAFSSGYSFLMAFFKSYLIIPEQKLRQPLVQLCIGRPPLSFSALALLVLPPSLNSQDGSQEAEAFDFLLEKFRGIN